MVLSFVDVEDKKDMLPPFVEVIGETFGDAYNKLILEVYEKGIIGEKESYAFGTEKDVLSRECESRFVIRDALKEPIFSLAMPGIPKFPEYIGDVLLGTKDFQVKEGKYDYTYHQRIFDPSIPGGQLAQVIKLLCKHPYTNRAQVVIWNKPEDNLREEGQPCLQRIWFKRYDHTLTVRTDWRSRDLPYAFDQNVIAMIAIGKLVMECVNDYSNFKVTGILYVDRCDSLHVYEREHGDFEQRVTALKNKMKTNQKTTFSSSDKIIRAMLGGKDLFAPVEEIKKSVFDPIFKKNP